MAKTKTIVSAFNAGELSPKVYGRIDLQQYHNGCKSLLNTIVYPQGGCTKRYGFEFIGTLGIDPNLDPKQVRIEEFIFNRNETFVVIFSGDSSLRVYDCSTGRIVTDFSTSYSGDRVNQLSVHQSQDTMIITHPEVAPHSLVRDRSDAANVVWRYQPLELKNVPTYVFDKPKVTSWTNATMKFDQFAVGDAFTFTFKGAEHTLTYQSTFEVLLGQAKGNQDATALINSIAGVIGSDYTVEAKYVTVDIKFTSEIDPSLPGPTIPCQRLSEVVLTAKDQTAGGGAIAVVRVPAGRTLFINPAAKDPEEGTSEPVWSNEKGWPATVAIHQGRLWFGGSRSRPQTLWGSRSGNYFDFGVTDPDNLLANDALDLTLADTKSNLIVGMVSQKALLVFTNGGVFTIDGENNLVTPTSVYALKQSEFGSKYATPVQMDNAVMYLQSQGAQLNSIVYSYASDSWMSNPQALLSDHLLKGPRSMCIVGAADDYNSNFMFVCNDDGTLAMFNRLEAQETSTWTPIRTDGFISSTCGVYDSMWAVVQRADADGNTIFSLERYAEDNEYMDAYITHKLNAGEVTQTVYPNNRKIFRNKDLVAVADGYPIRVRCDDNNIVNLPFAANTVKIGLPYEMEIETMPYAIDLQSGNTRWARKRVMSAKFDMVDSLGFDVLYAGRKYQVADRRMGFKLKEAPKPMTEAKEVRLLGYNQDGNIKISSTEPVPVSLRSLQIEVVVTG